MDKINKLKRKRNTILAVIAITALVFILLIVNYTLINPGISGRASSGSSGSANLRIFSDSDLGLNRYSMPNRYDNVSFFANYSKILNGEPISGLCNISFNILGYYEGWDNMTYNPASYLYEYNKSFAYKGTHGFKVSCTSSEGDVNLVDSFVISNTAPSIMLESGGTYIDLDSRGDTSDYFQCFEDSPCYYNFRENISEHDLNDLLEYGWNTGANTTLLESEFSLDENTGMLTINVAGEKRYGEQKIELKVKDSESQFLSGILKINVTAVNDAPIITKIGNKTAGVGKSFYLKIQASDTNLTGDDDSNMLTFSLIGDAIFNINSSGAITNSTEITQDKVGNYTFNASVSDPEGKLSSEIFYAIVYDSPQLESYFGDNVNAKENGTINLTVFANHTIGNNLNYKLYLEDQLKINDVGVGNGSDNYTFYFTPGFDDETCGESKNLTITVSNAEFSNSSSWNISVNYTNYPIRFIEGIENITASSSITLQLLRFEKGNGNYGYHFYDQDVFDKCHNQSLSLSFVRMNSSLLEVSEGPISVAFNLTAKTVTFSADSDSFEFFRITANDSEYVAYSNNFSVNLTINTIVISVPEPVPAPSSGGGGGSSSEEKQVPLKLIVPGAASVFQLDRIELPVKVINQAKRKLNDISLSVSVSKDGKTRDDVKASLSLDKISSLNEGESKDITLIVTSQARELGTYEVLINANVREPKFSDWGKIYLQINQTNSSSVERMIIFTEELIVGNPECLELKERINEAQKKFNEGSMQEAFSIANSVVEACKNAISAHRAIENPFNYKQYIYISTIVLGGILIIGFAVYYIYRKVKFKKIKSF